MKQLKKSQDEITNIFKESHLIRYVVLIQSLNTTLLDSCSEVEEYVNSSSMIMGIESTKGNNYSFSVTCKFFQIEIYVYWCYVTQPINSTTNWSPFVLSRLICPFKLNCFEYGRLIMLHRLFVSLILQDFLLESFLFKLSVLE